MSKDSDSWKEEKVIDDVMATFIWEEKDLANVCHFADIAHAGKDVSDEEIKDFLLACDGGQTETVQQLLKKKCALINKTDKFSNKFYHPYFESFLKSGHDTEKQLREIGPRLPVSSQENITHHRGRNYHQISF